MSVVGTVVSKTRLGSDSQAIYSGGKEWRGIKYNYAKKCKFTAVLRYKKAELHSSMRTCMVPLTLPGGNEPYHQFTDLVARWY